MTSSVDQQHRLSLKRGNLNLRERGGAEQLIFWLQGFNFLSCLSIFVWHQKLKSQFLMKNTRYVS